MRKKTNESMPSDITWLMIVSDNKPDKDSVTYSYLKKRVVLPSLIFLHPSSLLDAFFFLRKWCCILPLRVFNMIVQGGLIKQCGAKAHKHFFLIIPMTDSMLIGLKALRISLSKKNFKLNNLSKYFKSKWAFT